MPNTDRDILFTYGAHGVDTTGIIATPGVATDVLTIDCRALISVKTFWIYPISGASVTYAIYGTGDHTMTREEFEAHPVDVIEEITPDTLITAKDCKTVVAAYMWLKLRVSGTGSFKADFAGS